jgi:hypothetical protein
MHEATLRDFLTGVVSAEALREDLVGTVEELGKQMHRHHVVPVEGEFQVSGAQLVRLCDAVLTGHLDPSQLTSIGFCMIVSDYFHWDDETRDGFWVGETLHEWGSPEINYPLTQDNVRLFRERLITGKDVLKNARVA